VPIVGGLAAAVVGVTVAVKAMQVAQAAHAAVWAGWTLATQSGTAATISSRVAVLAANSAMLTYMATLGAAAAAIGALIAVYQQWQGLTAQTQDASIGTALLEGVGSIGDKGFLQGFSDSIDEQQSNAARRRFYEERGGPPGPGGTPPQQVVGPEQIQRSVTEKIETTKAEVELKLPPGVTAEVKDQKGDAKVPIKVTPTGKFSGKKT
jgi:hypothetical protein